MKRLFAFLIIAFSTAITFADQPLSIPEVKEVYSNNKKFVAVMNPQSQFTAVYRISKKGRRGALWSIKGWFRQAYLADDGQHLVVGYDGENLLPVNYSKDMVMISFFKVGRLIRQVKLNEIIKDFGTLQGTASHYQWGSYLGINPRGQLVLETVENKKIGYDIKTGLPVSLPTDQ